MVEINNGITYFPINHGAGPPLDKSSIWNSIRDVEDGREMLRIKPLLGEYVDLENYSEHKILLRIRSSRFFFHRAPSALRKTAKCGLRQSRRNLLLQPAVKRAVATLRNRTLIYALKFENCPGQCASSRKRPARYTGYAGIQAHVKQPGEKVEY